MRRPIVILPFRRPLPKIDISHIAPRVDVLLFVLLLVVLVVL